MINGTGTDDSLPTKTQIRRALADYQGKDPYAYDEDKFSLLNPIDLANEPTDLTQTVHYIASDPNNKKNLYECPLEGGECTYCEDQTSNTCGQKQVFMYCDGVDPAHSDRWRCYNFNSDPKYTRSLRMNTANEWKISGSSGNHIFHIHVNPFQVARKYVYPKDFDFIAAGMNPDELVWKDTLLAPQYTGGPNPGADPIMKTRYTRYPGAFVQHCHVLHHEDRGMMQAVEVEPTIQYIEYVLGSERHKDLVKYFKHLMKE